MSLYVLNDSKRIWAYINSLMPIPIIKNMGKTCFNERFSFFDVGIKIIGKEQRGIGEDVQGLKIAKVFNRRL